MAKSENRKEYIESSTVVFTQSIEKKAAKNFEVLFERLKKFAEKNKHKKPKKGELLAKLINDGVGSISPESYF